MSHITIRIDPKASAWATFDENDAIIGKWVSYEDVERGLDAACRKAQLMGCVSPKILTVKAGRLPNGRTH
jgi:hypothetical protein